MVSEEFALYTEDGGIASVHTKYVIESVYGMLFVQDLLWHMNIMIPVRLLSFYIRAFNFSTIKAIWTSYGLL